MSKLAIIRALIHIPVGLLNIFCFCMGLWVNIPHTVAIASGFTLFLGFFIYELEENMHLKDGAYIDIFGWLLGFSLGMIGVFCKQVLG